MLSATAKRSRSVSRSGSAQRVEPLRTLACSASPASSLALQRVSILATVRLAASTRERGGFFPRSASAGRSLMHYSRHAARCLLTLWLGAYTALRVEAAAAAPDYSGPPNSDLCPLRPRNHANQQSRLTKKNGMCRVYRYKSRWEKRSQSVFTSVLYYTRALPFLHQCGAGDATREIRTDVAYTKGRGTRRQFVPRFVLIERCNARTRCSNATGGGR